MPGSLDPYTPEELWGVFSAEFGSTNKHLLILLSLAVGVYAQRAMELGVGPSTRALRAAMKITGGRLWSCDIDRPRFAENLPRQDEHWSLALCPSGEFFRSLEPPFDFAFHDAAHDYWQVKEDLRRMLPLMRRYALICIHDTQNSLYGQTLVRAIEDAVKDSSVAYVHLPFSMASQSSVSKAVLIPHKHALAMGRRRRTDAVRSQPHAPCITDRDPAHLLPR